MNNLTTQTGFYALSEDQKEAHRAKIGLRVRALLGQFWQNHDVSDAEKAIEVEGWIDVLEDCSHSEIRYAWRDYQMNLTNRNAKGRLMKPDAGLLRRIITAKRPKPEPIDSVVETKAYPRDRVTKEEAAAILAEADFHPSRGFAVYEPKKFN